MDFHPDPEKGHRNHQDHHPEHRTEESEREKVSPLDYFDLLVEREVDRLVVV